MASTLCLNGSKGGSLFYCDLGDKTLPMPELRLLFGDMMQTDGLTRLLMSSPKAEASDGIVRCLPPMLNSNA